MSSTDLRNVRAAPRRSTSVPPIRHSNSVSNGDSADRLRLPVRERRVASVRHKDVIERRHRQRALHHISSHLTFLITGEKTRKLTSKLVLRQHHRFQVISGCRGRSCLKKWQQEASAGVSWSLVTWSAEVHRCADWHVRKSRGKSWPHCAPLMLCGQPAAYTGTCVLISDAEIAKKPM